MSEIKTDTLPFDSPEGIIELLKSLPLASDQGLNAAETLQKMSKEPLRLVESMMPLVSHEDKEIVEIMRKYGLQGIFGSITPFLRDESSVSDKKHIIDEIIKAASSPGLKSDMLEILRSYIFSIFLNFDTDFQVRGQVLAEIREKLDHEDLHRFRAYINIVLAIINATSSNPDGIINAFGFIQEKLMRGGAYIIETLEVELAKYSQDPTQKENLDSISLKLDTLQYWGFILMEVFLRLKDSESPEWQSKIVTYQEKMANSDYTILCLLKMLGLSLVNDKQIMGSTTLFSTTEIENIDTNLNNIKAIALRCSSIILSISNKPESAILLNPETNRFLAYKANILQGVNHSLFNLCTKYYKEIPKRLKDKSFESCLKACIEFVARTTPFKKPDNPFFDTKEHIIMSICFPLIASNEEDLKLLDEDPESYFERTMDFDGEIDEEGHIKLKVLKLIRALCDKVDGAVSSVAFYLGMLIEYSFLLDNPLLVGEQYPKLAPYLQSPVHDIIPPKIRVETCLLIWTASYDYIVDRPDLMPLIEQMFVRYFDFFMKTEDTFIRVRVALFLEMYLSRFFKTDEEMYRKHLFALVEWSSNPDPSKAIVANQVTKVLSNMFSMEEDIQRISPYLAEITEQLILQIPYKTSAPIFDLIAEAVENLDVSGAPNLIPALVTLLVERLTKEFDDPQHTPLMNKMWGVIRRIGEKETYADFQEDIEDILAPLFIRTMNDGLRYDEDVINFIHSTVRLTKCVSTLAWEVVNYLPNFLNNKFNLNFAFNMINEIIAHDYAHINKDKNLIKMFLDIAFEALRNPSKDDLELSLASTAMLFHLMIQKISIPEEGLLEILHEFYIKLTEDCHSKNLKARFGGVFLLAFLYEFESTQLFFAEMPAKLEYIVNFFIHEIAVFNEHMYDQKVYIISLSKFLTKSNLHPIIKENIPIILDRLVSFLTYIQYVEKVKSQDKPKIKSKPHYEDDEDEEDDDDEEQDNKTLRAFLQKAIDNKLIDLKQTKSGEDEGSKQESDDEEEEEEEEEKEENDQDDSNGDLSVDSDSNMDIRLLINGFVSDIKFKDEYEAFKDAIIHLQKSNFALLKEYAKNLPQQKKQYLKEMLKTRKIIIDQEKGISKTRKILKAIRGKVLDA